jgi:putative ABC transport system permease protein
MPDGSCQRTPGTPCFLDLFGAELRTRGQEGVSMGSTWQDALSGLRMIQKNPGFAAVVVMVLALGIGVNTTIFGVVNSLLFAPLPYQEADRLVTVMEAGERLRYGGPTSYGTFLDWQQQNQALDDLSAFSPEYVNLTGGGEPERLGGIRVSQDALSLLGARPIAGRWFLAGEFVPGRDQAVLLSHNLWQRHFAGSRQILGQTLTVDGQSCTIVGILPPHLELGMILGFEPALWMPLAPGISEDRGSRSLLAIGRLRPGITRERAQADMKIISQRIGESHPDTNRGWSAVVSPLRGEVDTLVYVLLILMVTSILGLVCANVINLMLARISGREREIAIRAALGASRTRLVRLVLTENLLLLVMGGSLGILAAIWACRLINSRFADTNLGMLDVRIDARVMAATLGLFFLAGALVGLMPALQVTRAGLSQKLKNGGRTPAGSVSKRRLKNLLVAVEVACSLLLLMGASLTLKSWFRLWDVDLGFRPAQVLTMRISLTRRQYPDDARQVAFFKVLLDRLQIRPGIQSAGAASSLPTAAPERPFTIEGHPSPAPGEAPQARFTVVSPGYFAAMTMPLKAGRQFTGQDAEHSPPVAVINEAMAIKYWRDQSPAGSRIHVAGAVRTIVGVVSDVKSVPLSLKPVPEIYVPFAQNAGREMALVVKTTASDPLAVIPAVKEELRSLDPDQPVSRIMTMEKVCALNMGVIQFGTSVLSMVALGALILASVGLYGVLSFSVSQRTNEIGVRIAIGARPADVLKLVLRQGMIVTLCGVVPGLAASLVLGRAVSRAIFGVSPVEPGILAGISILLIAVALAACYFPARRAAGVDPMQALRS